MTDATGVTVGADVVALKGETVTILADTNELQTDWVNGGRLDLIVDAILVDTGTTLDDKLDIIQLDVTDVLVDTSTTLDGNITSILADTNELQEDWADGGRLDVILDAASAPSAATVADAVWDEVLSGHVGAGSAGAALAAAGSAGDPGRPRCQGRTRGRHRRQDHRRQDRHVGHGAPSGVSRAPLGVSRPASPSARWRRM